MKTACIRITRFGPPEVPGAGEVDVAAPEPPFIPGVQANGVVESIGSGVSNLAVCDLLGGQAPLLFSSMATTIPFV